MKLFSSTSTRVWTVRKDGFYPSLRTATLLVERLSPVTRWSPSQKKVAVHVLTNGIPVYSVCEEEVGQLSPVANEFYNTFSGSEIELINRLVAWWTMDDSERDNTCFNAVDLNLGVSICILAK